MNAYDMSRIDSYLIRYPSCAPRKGMNFLDLPKTVRLQIYELSGLVRSCSIHLNTIKAADEVANAELNNADTRKSLIKDTHFVARHKCQTMNRYRDCSGQHSHLPTQLLFVSRSVHEETLQLLYQANVIEITLESYGEEVRGFDVFLKLPSHIVHRIEHLTIRLNRCTCGWRERDPKCSCQRGLPLSSSHLGYLELKRQRVKYPDPWPENDFRQWEAVLNHISGSITPGRLALTVILHTEAVEVASRFLRPLKKLSNLRSCAVRLWSTDNRNSERPPRELRTLAKDFSRNFLVRGGENFSLFPSLPPELKREVLRQAGLAKPFRIVLWQVLSWQEAFPGCCGSCDPNAAESDDVRICYCPDMDSNAAFSTSCTCETARSLPKPLVEANREMCQLARQVFFSENTFLLTPGFKNKFVSDSVKTYPSINWTHADRWYGDTPPFDTDWLGNFSRRFPRHALPFLRRVVIQIPFVNERGDVKKPGVQRAIRREWAKVLELLAQNLDLPKVTLTIDMSLEHLLQQNGLRPIVLSRGNLNTVQAHYNHIVEMMVRKEKRAGRKSFTRLRALFIYISYPPPRPPPDDNPKKYHGPEGLKLLREDEERELERRVMGPEYDSRSLGKKPFPDHVFQDDGHPHDYWRWISGRENADVGVVPRTSKLAVRRGRGRGR